MPERGPIGANCLANSRDFMTPVAAYEDRDVATELYVKWGGQLYRTSLQHSPLDVVAWHGNYAPYKYDLRRYSPVGPVLYDHADPSIFTVLTAPSETPGTANIDFVIFPERWLVAENTFRPPWYHMNIMSEFMGLIYGVYDAKPEGFVPGGISLHNCMLPHGPDAQAFEHASNVELKPVKLTGTMAFMFETRFPQRVTQYAAGLDTLQSDYADCWNGLEKRFDPDAAVIEPRFVTAPERKTLCLHGRLSPPSRFSPSPLLAGPKTPDRSTQLCSTTSPRPAASLPTRAWSTLLVTSRSGTRPTPRIS